VRPQKRERKSEVVQAVANVRETSVAMKPIVASAFFSWVQTWIGPQRIPRRAPGVKKIKDEAKKCVNVYGV
jgi:hypothetical protein